MKNLVRLARPLQLLGHTYEVEFSPGYILAAPSPMHGVLYIFPSTEEYLTDEEPDVGSFDDFEAFHGREGKFVSGVTVPNTWTKVDKAFQIVYLSHKRNGGGNGKPNRFRHLFGKNVLIERSRGWLRLSSPTLYVSERGIVN